MKPIHVAVGVIRGADGHILISRRAAHQHQGGLWEFPGGKVEDGETVLTALRRELAEELAIEVCGKPQPLCRINHDYGDRRVLLDVWLVDQFLGEATGLESQPLRWLSADALDAAEFPQANRPIIRRLQLRNLMLITSADESALRDRMQCWSARQDSLIQLRLPGTNDARFEHIAGHFLTQLQQPRRVMLNTSAALAQHLHQTHGAGGCHLNRHQLQQHQRRPVPDSMLLGASCHNLDELHQAAAIGADYALLSPVASTPSHPGQAVLGWAQFAALAQAVPIPVYALGGMCISDLAAAQRHGGCGIAGISLAHELCLPGADG